MYLLVILSKKKIYPIQFYPKIKSNALKAYNFYTLTRIKTVNTKLQIKRKAKGRLLSSFNIQIHFLQ